jgi:hypothetical protein
VILLSGGSKKPQAKDIRLAQTYWRGLLFETLQSAGREPLRALQPANPAVDAFRQASLPACLQQPVEPTNKGGLT